MERIPTIGPAELVQLQKSFSFPAELKAPAVPFPEETLKKLASSHILIYTPESEITINWMRGKFGTDPSLFEPCFYNQDWYLNEEFAKRPLDGKWHLMRKNVLEEARAKEPAAIESSLKGEQFPSAVTCAFTFFVWYLLKKEILWKHDFVWCSDRDHNGDRIYVGRYEDPEGVNKNGFNIHRHLSLKPNYSAVPEIVG